MKTGRLAGRGRLLLTGRIGPKMGPKTVPRFFMSIELTPREMAVSVFYSLPDPFRAFPLRALHTKCIRRTWRRALEVSVKSLPQPRHTRSVGRVPGMIRSRSRGARATKSPGTRWVSIMSGEKNTLDFLLGASIYSLRIAHRKWKETNLQPGTAGPGNMLGCCLVSFHFLWVILCPQAVQSGYIGCNTGNGNN